MTRKIFAILAFTGLTAVCYAQTPADTLLLDTVRTDRFLPTGLRIGTDMISLVRSQLYDDFSGWEVNADVDIHRYILSADIGTWSRNFLTDSSSYSSSYKNDGRYWRLGIDANFLTRDEERNAFFLGFRYGRSKFSEYMDISANDSIWGPFTRNYVNSDMTARWFELAGGLKVKMWKSIWMGYTASMKFGLKTDENAAILSHNIPGYGRTDRDMTWGFTYQIFFRIPFRPVQSILPPKKKK